MCGCVLGCFTVCFPPRRRPPPPSQENVMVGAYSPVELCVRAKNQEISCRTYVMNSCVYAPPSPQYLQVSPPLAAATFHPGRLLSLVCSRFSQAHVGGPGGRENTHVLPSRMYELR